MSRWLPRVTVWPICGGQLRPPTRPYWIAVWMRWWAVCVVMIRELCGSVARTRWVRWLLVRKRWCVGGNSGAPMPPIPPARPRW